MNVNEILLIFCQYGFRKASMEDIAQAAGLSRQSIYKKFGSKEAVFEWVINEAVGKAFEEAMLAMGDENKPVAERLADAFDRWAGDFVPVMRGTPHGTELLDRSIEYLSRDGHRGEEDFYSAVESLLLDSGIAGDRPDASDKAHTLALAAKGLLLRVETVDLFRQNMLRVIRAISPRPS